MSIATSTEERVFTRTAAFLWICTLLAAIVCAVFILRLQREATGSHVASDTKIHVSLGVLAYEIKRGKAVKRHDASTAALYSFLSDAARKDIRSGCDTAYYSVVAYTPDKTQLFIKYGCAAPDSPIYAVKQHNTWNFISPTNHFDIFGIPDCTYVTAHNINPRIAPVCATNLNADSPQYATRS